MLPVEPQGSVTAATRAPGAARDPASPAADSGQASIGASTLAELDALLARAASEVQLGMEEGASRIGRYTLVTPVGEGGFGTVWLASQEEPVRRLVALKLLRRDPGSKMILSRFQNERQTLARMDHPNVATVLDAGVTDDGRPWFVMPFIDGLPINALCDERRMLPRDRVRLFAEVCDGVQHAHQKGVIHRDIKPGNILVTRASDRAVPKVIDFGVAKALDAALTETMRTAEGQRLGTPQYMPPEQWMHGAGTADARSDVYALGVVLAELLVGGPPTRLPRTPLEVPELVPPGTWLADLAARDPAAARKVAAARGMGVDELLEAVRGDLESIVRRACATHPEDRYATAAALAEDLRRWLDGRPVAARLLAPWERSWRFVLRHRVGTALGGLAAVAVLVALVVWIGETLASSRERALTESAQRHQEQTFRLAQGMIQELVDRQRSEKDPEAGHALFSRIEQMLERIAEDDPLTAARLAAIVARGHEESWQQRAAYALLQRSFGRLLEVDPDGTSTAFAELAPEVYRAATKYDRPLAAELGPGVFLGMLSSGRFHSPEARSIFQSSVTERQPWPFCRIDSDQALGFAAAQFYASTFDDPVEASCAHALARIGVLTRGGIFGKLDELFAARAYLRSHLPPDDHRLMQAEMQVCTLMALEGMNSEDSVQAMALHCARAEHALGIGSPRTVNAYWNLCYSCVNLGRFEDGYQAYVRMLWPEYRRQVPSDGLRRWYLGYFAPIAYRVGDLDTAYMTAMTQLADDAEEGSIKRDGVAQLSAKVLAGVLAAWGDDAGAREIEQRYGVQRLPECSDNW